MEENQGSLGNRELELNLIRKVLSQENEGIAPLRNVVDFLEKEGNIELRDKLINAGTLYCIDRLAVGMEKLKMSEVVQDDSEIIDEIYSEATHNLRRFAGLARIMKNPTALGDASLRFIITLNEIAGDFYPNRDLSTILGERQEYYSGLVAKYEGEEKILNKKEYLEQNYLTKKSELMEAYDLMIEEAEKQKENHPTLDEVKKEIRDFLGGEQ